MNESDFIDAFIDSQYRGNFSSKGLKAMYNFFDNVGVNVEFDLVAIACEYTEFKNWEEFKTQYPDIKSMEDLQNKTTVIGTGEDNFIILNF